MQPFLLIFGKNAQNPNELITLPISQLTHTYIQGGTGQGKTSLLAYLLASLISQGVGVTVIDPGGDLSYEILVRLVMSGYFEKYADAPERVMYLDIQRAHEAERYIGMNVLAGNYDAHAAAHVLLEGFKRVWPALQDGTATNIETLVSNGAYVLAERGLPLLPFLNLLYTNQEMYRALVPAIKDRTIAEQFKSLGLEPRPGHLPEISATTTKRVNRLAFSPDIRYALSQTENILDAAALVNSNRSVLLNLHLADPNAKKLFGCLITEHFEMFSKSRGKLSAAQAESRYVLAIDEVQNFAFQSGEAISNMFAESRKANVFTWIAHQYGAQLSEDFRAALTQCDTVINFAVGYDDAVEAVKRLGFPVDPHKVKEETGNPFSPSGTHKTYYSLPEQRELQAAAIQRLRQREAFIRLPVDHRYMMRTFDLGTPTPAQLRHIEELKDFYLQHCFRPKAEIEQGIDELLWRFAPSQSQAANDTINAVNTPQRPNKPRAKPISPPRRPSPGKTSKPSAQPAQSSPADAAKTLPTKPVSPPPHTKEEPPAESSAPDDDLDLPEDEYDLF